MSLSIYTDESVPVQVAAGLRRRNVEALSARDSRQLGFPDDAQLRYARGQRAVLFTHDNDFLRIAAEWSQTGESHAGIVYVHQDKLTIGDCIRKLKEIAEVFEIGDFQNHIEFL